MAVKKKKFFEVEVPLINEEVHLIGYEWEDINNRVINLDLTRMLRGKNIDFKAKVIVQGEKAQAYPVSITLLQYFLRKAVRKGTDYVEDSFETECKDAVVRIKPFLITRKRVSRPVLNSLRSKAKAELTAWAKEHTVDELFEDVLKNKIQKPLSLMLKKVYPLSLCEVRMLEVVSWKTKPTFIEYKVKEKSIEVETEDTEEKPTKKKKSDAESVDEESTEVEKPKKASKKKKEE
jgi:ribosomal protein S3AE